MNALVLINLIVSIYLIPIRASEECYTVYKNWHYANYGLDFWGFHDGYMETAVSLNNNTAQYLFSPDNQDGHLCMTSWNKLYGGSRCGYTHPHHEDSDRFVWRRHQDCLIFNGTRVVGVKKDCKYKDKIQIAAYAYDDGHLPYQNASLLTIFDYLLDVTATYTISISFEEHGAQYNLSSSISTGKKLLESHYIKHRYCDAYQHGYSLGLYFGGQCTAPQDVTVCYDSQTGRKMKIN